MEEKQLSTFDVETRRVQIYGEVNSKLAKDFSNFINEISNSPMAVLDHSGGVMDRAPGEIVIEIFSAGGCSFSALNIYNLLKSKTPKGIRIVTVGNGLVSSAATIIFAAGDIRQAYKNTRFLIHETSLSQLSGKSSEIADNASLMKSIEEDFIEIYKTASSNAKTCKEFLKNININKNKDWIFSGTEAFINYGFATELIDYNR